MSNRFPSRNEVIFDSDINIILGQTIYASPSSNITNATNDYFSKKSEQVVLSDGFEIEM